MSQPKTERLKSGARARLVKLRAVTGRPVAPQRVVVPHAPELRPGEKWIRDAALVVWLEVGMVVLGGVIPRWQLLLSFGLIGLTPLLLLTCVFAMVRGKPFRGSLYLIGGLLLVLAEVFSAGGGLALDR